jgi:hypothetical protein
MNDYRDPLRLPAPTLNGIDGATGERVRVYNTLTVIGDQDAVDAYSQVRQYAVANGPIGRRVIATVENARGYRTIVRSYRVDGPHGTPEATPKARHEIAYDQQGGGRQTGDQLVTFGINQALFSGNGSRVSPADSLMHELQHIAEGLYRSVLLDPLGRFTNRFEKRAVLGVEAEGLNANGVPARDTHFDGITYQTTGVTGRIAANPQVEQLFQQATPILQEVTRMMQDFGVDLERTPPRIGPRPPVPVPRNGPEAVAMRDHMGSISNSM